jgi:hypothetical protein
MDLCLGWASAGIFALDLDLARRERQARGDYRTARAMHVKDSGGESG